MRRASFRDLWADMEPSETANLDSSEDSEADDDSRDDGLRSSSTSGSSRSSGAYQGCESAGEHELSSNDDESDEGDDEHDEAAAAVAPVSLVRCSLCHEEIDLTSACLRTAAEELDCDRGCGRRLPPGELRFGCRAVFARCSLRESGVKPRSHPLGG